ncbi:MAG: peptidoglycan endopeptidase [Sphingomonadaceae bacterium]|nr:peptidoglycan endopeptidase [Sphingomonadaceae bacterium]
MAAVALVGCPFKLHGRRADAGVDCVGLAAVALANAGRPVDIPDDYAMRGDYMGRISAFFDGSGFTRIDNARTEAGDFLICSPAPRQLHLLIADRTGAVHAHAGLRRVVLTPFPLPWPVAGHWRFIGD